MIDETIVTQAATRAGQTGNLFELHVWFFKRVLTTILLILVVSNLLYIHFFLPEGLAGISYALITGRWTDPTWGAFWQIFDWLLVVLGFLHLGNGLEQILRPQTQPGKRYSVLKTGFNVVFFILIILSAQIIFSF